MSDEFLKPHTPNQTGSGEEASTELGATQEGHDARQNMRKALLPYARSLADHADPPKQRIDCNDLLTLLSICKQAYTAEEMLAELTPELLPLITERLLPAVAPRERKPAVLALAHLSDHPLWHQKMVMLGYADEVSGPATFIKYEDFIKAVYSINEGRWTFNPYELRELSGRNFSFTTNFDCAQAEEAYLHLCERARLFFEEWKRKYMPDID